MKQQLYFIIQTRVFKITTTPTASQTIFLKKKKKKHKPFHHLEIFSTLHHDRERPHRAIHHRHLHSRARTPETHIG